MMDFTLCGRRSNFFDRGDCFISLRFIRNDGINYERGLNIGLPGVNQL